MYIIRKKFKIEYSHQLVEAYSCACSDCIHGHHGVIDVFFKSDTLDHTDMLIDFGEVKTILNDYIMNFDHSLIMSDQMDQEYLDSLKKYNKKLIIVPFNPTAEAFSKHLFIELNKLMDSKENVTISKVRFHETPTGYAEYFEDK